MKFLVTGSAGLVGSQVIRDLSESANQIYSCYHNSKPEYGTPVQMNLASSDSIKTIINKVHPDCVIHLAAMTNVDLCETQKDLAMTINATATKIIAKQSALQGAFLVYVSTDYVFDGNQGMKKEADIPNPVDFYGKSKLEGEKAVMNMASGWCIARTSTPFGVHKTKTSFPKFVIENLHAKKEIKAVTDQYTSSTYVANLSQMLIELARRQITGVIHVAGATRISRFDMANLIAEKLALDKSLIKPATVNEMKWAARRPKDSSLDVSKAFSILNNKPQPIDQSLEQFINEIKSSHLID